MPLEDILVVETFVPGFNEDEDIARCLQDLSYLQQYPGAGKSAMSIYQFIGT